MQRGERMNSKYLKFVKYGDIYLILTKNTRVKDINDLIECDPLGSISYYGKWNKYVFIATSNDYVFNAECLNDIIKFMESLK